MRSRRPGYTRKPPHLRHAPGSFDRGQVCPRCQLSYERFRTGLTYHQVWTEFWIYGDDRARWRNKRRSSVLGRWHQIKRELWLAHLDGCDAEPVPF